MERLRVDAAEISDDDTKAAVDVNRDKLEVEDEVVVAFVDARRSRHGASTSGRQWRRLSRFSEVQISPTPFVATATPLEVKIGARAHRPL